MFTATVQLEAGSTLMARAFCEKASGAICEAIQDAVREKCQPGRKLPIEIQMFTQSYERLIVFSDLVRAPEDFTTGLGQPVSWEAVLHGHIHTSIMQFGEVLNRLRAGQPLQVQVGFAESQQSKPVYE